MLITCSQGLFINPFILLNLLMFIQDELANITLGILKDIVIPSIGFYVTNLYIRYTFCNLLKGSLNIGMCCWKKQSIKYI